MEPPAYSSVPTAPPMSNQNNEGLPRQPKGPRMVQYTTVNMVSEPPKDHFIWSLCWLLYGNPCCLGLIALVYSVKARDRKVVGDVEGARHYGSTARYINIVSTVLVSILIFAFIIVTIVVLTRFSSISYTTGYKYHAKNFPDWNMGW